MVGSPRYWSRCGTGWFIAESVDLLVGARGMCPKVSAQLVVSASGVGMEAASIFTALARTRSVSAWAASSQLSASTLHDRDNILPTPCFYLSQSIREAIFNPLRWPYHASAGGP
jgi:hypothetical protein